MANMPHCRFRNTLRDLEDSYDHMSDKDLSEEEQEARARLIKLCAEITNWYAIEEEEDA